MRYIHVVSLFSFVGLFVDARFDQSVFFCWSFDDAAELFEVLSPLGRVD